MFMYSFWCWRDWTCNRPTACPNIGPGRYSLVADPKFTDQTRDPFIFYSHSHQYDSCRSTSKKKTLWKNRHMLFYHMALICCSILERRSVDRRRTVDADDLAPTFFVVLRRHRQRCQIGPDFLPNLATLDAARKAPWHMELARFPSYWYNLSH